MAKLNALDKVIAYISPSLGATRALWREEIQERSYDAGNSDRLNSNWIPINGTAEQTDSVHRDIIRGRARDLERNSDMAESIIAALERNVAGTGFTLQAKIGDSQSDSEVELNSNIENLFKKWCKPKYCDVSGQQSFNEMVRMAVRRIETDGGIIFIKCATKGGLIPFKLQSKEVDDLATTVDFRSTSGRRVAGGIEFDSFNKPVAFYFKKYSPDGYLSTEIERIDADRVIYLYMKRRPSQIREMSMLSRTLPRIRDMNEYATAVAVKERIAAYLAVFIKKINPSTSFGRGGKVDKKTEYKQRTMTPGMISELEPGEEIGVVTPPNSGNGLKDFMTVNQRLSGAGQGLSYEVTSRDMSQVNYSSARQGLIEDQTTYKIWQEFLIDHFLSEIYEEFLMSAVLSGLIKIKDYSTNVEKYNAHSWLPPGWAWIDPAKEAKANQTALDGNFDTLESICANRGRDWKDVLKQRSKEIEYAKSLKLTADFGSIQKNESNVQSESEIEEVSTEEKKTNEKSSDEESSKVLNGAQVQSLVTVVASVSSGTITYDSAKAILMSSFLFSEDEAISILGAKKEEGK